MCHQEGEYVIRFIFHAMIPLPLPLHRGQMTEQVLLKLQILEQFILTVL